MCINQSRNHEPAVRILDARLRADVTLDSVGAADIDDPIAACR